MFMMLRYEAVNCQCSSAFPVPAILQMFMRYASSWVHVLRLLTCLCSCCLQALLYLLADCYYAQRVLAAKQSVRNDVCVANCWSTSPNSNSCYIAATSKSLQNTRSLFCNCWAGLIGINGYEVLLIAHLCSAQVLYSWRCIFLML